MPKPLQAGRRAARRPAELDGEVARAETYPPPYPAGWYVVARAADVTNRPRFVRCAGQDVAVFRGAEGRPHVVDAYCPHMGANLADGVVRDGCIECPFHAWRIAGDGRIRSVTDGAPARPGLRTTSWAVDDLHGWVCMYHRHGPLHREAAPEPPYRLQRVPEIDGGALLHRGDYDAGGVRMHLLEFVENSVDFQHFDAIHDQLRVPWTNVPVPGIRLQHRAGWHVDESEPHVAWFRDDVELLVRGRVIPGAGADARIRIEGPGGVVRFDFDLRGRGRVVLFQSHTPIAPLRQRIRFRWFSERRVPKLLASYVVGNWISQWRRDIGIWERKIYRRKPLLLETDGPVGQLRRWYSQFLPDAPAERETAEARTV
ncbi:MAG: Rieske 2Fe-2S domain-containing protein [Proteobacteria bacterium]|nr:Rieske 2Fe-2S domain-containing protein [Pseudomonadota bacterium]